MNSGSINFLLLGHYGPTGLTADRVEALARQTAAMTQTGQVRRLTQDLEAKDVAMLSVECSRDSLEVLCPLCSL